MSIEVVLLNKRIIKQQRGDTVSQNQNKKSSVSIHQWSGEVVSKWKLGKDTTIFPLAGSLKTLVGDNDDNDNDINAKPHLLKILTTQVLVEPSA